jgi:DNA polymerase III delta prime subunit
MGAHASSMTVVPMQRISGGFQSWQAWLDAAIHREILRLRARYELSLDEFRGLYVSDEQVDRLIQENLREVGTIGEIDDHCQSLLEQARSDSPMGRLQSEFELSESAIAALFVAYAPELDLKYQTLFAYLNNDVTKKCPTVELLQRLSEVSNSEISTNSTLFGEGLLETSGNFSHWSTAAVIVSPPVREFLGDIEPESYIAGIPKDPLAIAIKAEMLDTLVIERGIGGDPLARAREISRECGTQVMPFGEELSEDFSRRFREALLSARLRQTAIYFEPEVFGLDTEAPPSPEKKLRLQKALTWPVVKFFAVDGRSSWRPLFEHADHETISLKPPEPGAREEAWREALNEKGVRANKEDLATISRLFTLYEPQIERAASYIARRTPRKQVATWQLLSEAARRQCTTSLDAFAKRVEPIHGWEHLILPKPTFQRLKEFAGAIRHREKVFRSWSFLRQSGGQAALTALFSGASGTGKTMSASVIAQDLGQELYRIDLSAVVSKYIGETESNLERIFRAAEGSNAILFFDEADALFGKRSEVKDAHDRYANIEVAYLLQRMESYDGVMILATNYAQNIDEAFSRRIHFEIEYPMPDECNRERLWRLLIPQEAPRCADIDYAFLARQFALAGGDIRNVALDAAFLAAHEDAEIGMSQLVRALVRQRKKQGKLPSASDFKQYFELIRADDPRLEAPNFESKGKTNER